MLISALAPGDGRIVSDRDLNRPSVDALTVRVPWANLEANRDWCPELINDQAARAAASRRAWKLIVMTGKGNAPPWIEGQWLGGAPAPWSPQLHAALKAMVKCLDAHVAYKDYLSAVHVTGPTCPSAEMHPAPGLARARGYSRQAMIDSWCAAIDAYASAFDLGKLAISISVQPPADQYVADVCKYLVTRVGPRRAVIQHNSLQADTNAQAKHHRFVIDQKKKGRLIAFELACSAKHEPVRFGSPDVNEALALARAAGAEWCDVYPPDLAKVSAG